MPERQLVTLALGGGLQRATGSFVVRPGQARDLRNVYARVDSLVVRKGLDLTATLLDEDENPVSHTIALHAQRSLRIGIAVGYQQNGTHGGKVYVYRVTAFGASPELLQVEDTNWYWFQLAAGSPPPHIITDDTYGKVFLAHNELSLASRAQTVYYDPEEVMPVRDLVADFDGAGDDVVKFMGVRRHLSYMLGWGFGSASEDRPEFVRASMPGEPLEWDAEHYWLAGQRGDPVLNVMPAAAGAVVLKAHELHVITGYDRATFGIQPLDTIAGLLASRLAVAVHGDVIFWSHDGPRVTDGNGPSRDLGFNLDLQGLEPADLVTVGEIEDAFAAYIPTRKAVGMFFNRRVYVLCLDADQREWTYHELGQDAYSAGTLYVDFAVAPVGYPRWISASPSDFTATVSVAHVNARGFEILELWLKPDGGSWSRWLTTAVDLSKPLQDIAVSGLAADTDYEGALRYFSGGEYTPGYEGVTPDDWTATTAPLSKGDFTTTLTTRVLDDPLWERTSDTEEVMHLTWSEGPVDDTDLEKSVDGGANWTAVTTIASGVSLYDYVVQAGEEETYLQFRLKPSLGVLYSNEVEAWVGPAIPIGAPFGYDPVTGASGVPGASPSFALFDIPLNGSTIQGLQYHEFEGFNMVWLDNVLASYDISDVQTELWATVPERGGVEELWAEIGYESTVDYRFWFSEYPPPLPWEIPPILIRPDSTLYTGFSSITLRIRHKVTQYAVDDYSDFTEATVLIPEPYPD